MTIQLRATTLLAALPLLFNAAVNAQTPAVFATGLQYPSKIILGPAGTFLVTEAGTTPNSGRVSLIDATGLRHTVIDGLPSGLAAPDLSPDGPNGLLLDGNTLYILNGEGDGFRSGTAPGTLVANPAGPSSPIFASLLQVTLTSDITTLASGFSLKPVDHSTLLDGASVTLTNSGTDTATVQLLAAFRPGIPDARTIYRNSHPYGITMLNGALYVNDAGMNIVRKVDSVSGRTTTLARFPVTPNPTAAPPPVSEAVPTSIHAYGNQLLVTLLSGAPFVPGASRVMIVDPTSGKADFFITGLSSAIDLIYRTKPDGSPQFYVLDYSELLSKGKPGKLLVYNNPIGQTVVDGLPTPSSMVFDESNSTIYITDRADGTVLTIKP